MSTNIFFHPTHVRSVLTPEETSPLHQASIIEESRGRMDMTRGPNTQPSITATQIEIEHKDQLPSWIYIRNIEEIKKHAITINAIHGPVYSHDFFIKRDGDAPYSLIILWSIDQRSRKLTSSWIPPLPRHHFSTGYDKLDPLKKIQDFISSSQFSELPKSISGHALTPLLSKDIAIEFLSFAYKNPEMLRKDLSTCSEDEWVGFSEPSYLHCKESKYLLYTPIKKRLFHLLYGSILRELLNEKSIFPDMLAEIFINCSREKIITTDYLFYLLQEFCDLTTACTNDLNEIIQRNNPPDRYRDIFDQIILNPNLNLLNENQIWPLMRNLMTGKKNDFLRARSLIEKLYCTPLNFLNLDLARHSKIEAQDSDGRSPVPNGQGIKSTESKEKSLDIPFSRYTDEGSELAQRDQFGEVGTCTNPQNLTERIRTEESPFSEGRSLMNNIFIQSECFNVLTKISQGSEEDIEYSIEFLNFILEKGADPNIRISSTHKKNCSVLEIAADTEINSFQKEKILFTLLDHGAFTYEKTVIKKIKKSMVNTESISKLKRYFKFLDGDLL